MKNEVMRDVGVLAFFLPVFLLVWAYNRFRRRGP